MKKAVVFSLLFCLTTLAAEEHLFEGDHFLASYLGCNIEALNDNEKMLQVMDAAVKASGAVVVDRIFLTFEPTGITVLYLLSESHASIHTYPEHGACFVDLFTCGSHCSPKGFDKILRSYLNPETVNAKQFVRTNECVEVLYEPS